MTEKIQGSRSRSIHYSNVAIGKKDSKLYHPLPPAQKRFSNAEQINSRREKMRLKLLKKIADRMQQPVVVQPELQLVAIAILLNR